MRFAGLILSAEMYNICLRLLFKAKHKQGIQAMYKTFADTRLFVMTYLILVLPIYFLADSDIVGQSLSSLSLLSVLYVLSMVGILGICLIRGAIIGKNWLVLIPTVAFVFDLTPALTAISIVPYLYHSLAIFLGAFFLPVAVTHTNRYEMR